MARPMDLDELRLALRAAIEERAARTGAALIAPAPRLPATALLGCKVLPSRLHMLHELPRYGTVAEIGTQTGRFAAQIVERAQPRKLHIIDIDYSLFEREHFARTLADGTVELHEGDSSTILAGFAEATFDWVYVDGDHSYDGVRRDLQQAVRTVRPGGYVVCNDYTCWSPFEVCEYGVMTAVNEVCIEHGLGFAFLALHEWGYHDVALRKPAAAET